MVRQGRDLPDLFLGFLLARRFLAAADIRFIHQMLAPLWLGLGFDWLLHTGSSFRTDATSAAGTLSLAC